MAGYYIPLVATPQIGGSEGGGGGGGSVLVATMSTEDWTLDKTWEEIYEAYGTTGAVIATPQGDSAPALLESISTIGFNSRSSKYFIESGSNGYVAETAESYPQVTSE